MLTIIKFCEEKRKIGVGLVMSIFITSMITVSFPTEIEFYETFMKSDNDTNENWSMEVSRQNRNSGLVYINCFGFK